MTYPPGAEPGYRRTPLSAEEKARGEANFAPFVAQMLVASGRFRVSADTPDQVELFQGVARRVSDMLQRPVVSYANGREIVITFGQEEAPALVLCAARPGFPEAHAWLDARYETLFSSAFYEGSRWVVPVSPEMIEGQQTFFANPDSYPVDDRGVSYSMAFFSPKHTGAGSFYLMAINDDNGLPLEGARSYRLTVPPAAPVTQYWSATIYDRATHALIRDMPRSSRSSQSQHLTTNTDGSTDIYFSPDSPAGNEHNWVPTSRDGGFEVLFRFYGPQQPLFDKSWQLPDITKLT